MDVRNLPHSGTKHCCNDGDADARLDWLLWGSRRGYGQRLTNCIVSWPISQLLMVSDLNRSLGEVLDVSHPFDGAEDYIGQMELT